MTQLSFQVLKFIFSLVTSAILAWAISAALGLNAWLVFLALVLGLPAMTWLNRIMNIPAHLAAATILNKRFVADAKRALRKLPITTAQGWTDFQAFYETDEEIAKFRESCPKAWAAAVRSEQATLRQCGLFVPMVQMSWMFTQAMDQLWEEHRRKEELEFVRSHGFESWAEYMVVHGQGEDTRKSYEEAAAKEKLKRA